MAGLGNVLAYFRISKKQQQQQKNGKEVNAENGSKTQPRQKLSVTKQSKVKQSNARVTNGTEPTINNQQQHANGTAKRGEPPKIDKCNGKT